MSKTHTPPTRPPRSDISGGVPHRANGFRETLETIESIIIALILAFVFRAFVVEAFVIPTGSMAPSLRGMHANHRCANCGYAFAYGIKEQAVLPHGRVSAGTLDQKYYVQCPNCRWAGEGNRDLNSPANPVVPDAGDRILVLKWTYDLGGALLGPQRWDVGVFKNPQDGEMNYIKRIVGVPGEVLEIIHGDVYTADAAALSDELLAELEIPEPDRALSDDMVRELNRALRVRRKRPLAQESLWMLHYDHDHPSVRDRSDYSANAFNPPHWAPLDPDDTSWDATRPRVTFASDDDTWRWLRLEGEPIRDVYGYNNAYYRSLSPEQVGGAFPVGDVRVRFVLTARGSDGELAIYHRKGRDRFQITLSVEGDVRLDRIDTTNLPSGSPGIPRELASAKLPRPLDRNRPVQVEFENLDFRIALRIDGVEVLATDDKQYAPSPEYIARLRNADPHTDEFSGSEIRIGASRLPLELRHLQVHRDVYYTSRPLEHDPQRIADGEPAWGTAGNPIFLRTDPAEFFCCGDNSPQSQDSRLWVETSPFLMERPDYQRGTVPADQLIGHAFFVYWPSGLRFSRSTIGVIPNVGRMRFIR